MPWTEIWIQSSFEFGYNLPEQLILPQIRRRSKNGLTSKVIRKIEIVTGEVNANIENPEPNKPDRCRILLGTIKGLSYKTLKHKIGKVKGFCARCKSHCCNKHSVQYCKFVHSYFMTILHPKRLCIIFTLHMSLYFP